MSEPPPITVEALREHYARLGLFPSDQELESLLPVIQGLYEGASQIEALLSQEQEPSNIYALEA